MRLEQELQAGAEQAAIMARGFNRDGAAQHITIRIDPLGQQVPTAVEKLIDAQWTGARRVADEADAMAQREGRLLYLLGIIALVGSALISWLIARSITGPLREAVAIASRVADRQFGWPDRDWQ